MPIAGRFVVQSTTALLLVGLLALLGIVGMTIWLGERAQVYFDEVIEARDRAARRSICATPCRRAESSQRGFLLHRQRDLPRALRHRKDAGRSGSLEAVKRLLALSAAPTRSRARSRRSSRKSSPRWTETIALKRERRDAEALARSSAPIAARR